MFRQEDFVSCIYGQLEKQGFGKKRADKAVKEFQGRLESYKQQGHHDAGFAAMSDVFEKMAMDVREKAKRARDTFFKLAEVDARLEAAEKIITGTKFAAKGAQQNKGHAIARGLLSFFERDSRFADSANYATAKDDARGQLWALGNDIVEKMGKGFLGTQKGAAHMRDVVFEVFGRSTGNADAAAIAKGWMKIQEASVDLFNYEGGSLAKRSDFHLPQSQNAAKLLRRKDEWKTFHNDALAWDRMRWPDGSPIRPDQREAVLDKVYDVISSGGASKIEPGEFNGRGAALGNALDKHRFLVFKGPDEWLAMHEKFGDGNLFDVMAGHIEHMAHSIALQKTFGANPQMMADTMRAKAMKLASKYGADVKAVVEEQLKNKFLPQFELVTHHNAMDPHGWRGATVTSVANVLTAAQLGAAAIPAILGDITTTAWARHIAKTNLFGGADFYLKALATEPAFMRQIATQSGWIMDDAVSTIFMAQRFTGVATVGPAITRRLADGVMRLSGLSPHTRAARFSVQAEFMGMLARDAGKAFDDLPYRAMMGKNGISAADWDAFRQTPTWSPRADITFLRPIDAIAAGRRDLFEKFQGMIGDEAKLAVPEATIEAASTLKGTTRPDTLIGAILYSFAMYKNFPVSFSMIYGRAAMTNPDRSGRLGQMGGLIAAMTVMGGLAVQLRETSKGKDPLPMDNAEFLGKAMLAGGGLSIWGDFLFANINSFGRGPAETFAGPIAGWMGDTTNLLFGDVFKMAAAVGTLDQHGETKFLAKLNEYAKRYTPGSSLWWARLATERQVFDRLQELADPKAYQSFQRKRRKQQQDYGNDFWWAPGDRTPTRAPAF